MTPTQASNIVQGLTLSGVVGDGANTLGIYKTGTGIVGASFRQHFFTSSPTVTNGDDGAFLPNQCLTRIGSLDYNLADMVVHSDGVSCMGIPTSGYPITVDLPSGSVVYSLIEARGAYVRTAGETITTVAEVEQE